jgi:hypothetical protein
MQDDSYLPDSQPHGSRQSDAAQLTDFARYGILDAYELNDKDLAHLLELWRWTAWTERTTPSSVDHDILDAVHRLQQRLADQHGIDMEYNTAALFKQEIEALMFWCTLRSAPAALWYFVRRVRVWALIRAIRRSRRYDRLETARGQRRQDRGYPRPLLERFNGRPPDLLKRRYWRPLTPHSFEERRRDERWW